jgi:hypothetical protein
MGMRPYVSRDGDATVIIYDVSESVVRVDETAGMR